MANRVRKLIEKGAPAIGAHAKIPSPTVVEIAANAGLDFVRADHYHWPYDEHTLRAIADTAAALDITPWVRCACDPIIITSMLEYGFRGFTLPCVASASQASMAVQTIDRFVEKAVGIEREDILLGCAIENREGLESFEKIAALSGVDVLSTGPSDLAFALGERDKSSAKVQAEYTRILEQSISRGKNVYLSTRTSPTEWEKTRVWIRKGARIIIIEEEYRVLMKHLLASETSPSKHEEKQP
ncbi:aldolase/citrate lyase family protein [Ensifer sp. YR511]|uniref:aldolase/citrate lyase family protein n=1 Tax=Ensifer sp. YR511 TaxID=1855294 RepID=UPI0008856F4E|nr:aldolase/citrate lyase family protein [Ensifer sp. YR511]SDN73657.1 HpcH/HpaI aldolase/citrate lyase family protein [Ensifer sp. YR511]